MTITEFLLARIAEQEALVRDPRYIWSLDHPEIGAPEKVLADCEAKRQIVAEHSGEPGCETCYDITPGLLALTGAPCLTLRHLASVYADHEDYREEWRP